MAIVKGELESRLLGSILNQLDTTLSALRDAITGASPDNKTLNDLYAQLQSILAQLDAALSTRASEATLTSIDGKITKCDTDNVSVVSTANPPNLDVAVSTLATEATLSSILSQLDITLSALKDAVVNELSRKFNADYNVNFHDLLMANYYLAGTYTESYTPPDGKKVFIDNLIFCTSGGSGYAIASWGGEYLGAVVLDGTYTVTSWAPIKRTLVGDGSTTITLIMIASSAGYYYSRLGIREVE